MKNVQPDFKQRVDALEAKGRVRKRSGTSVLYEKRADGLLVQVTTADGESIFPWKTLAASLALMFALKTGLYVALGEQAVIEMADNLADKHMTGHVAVVLLQPEPVSGWLVRQTEDVINALR